MEPGWTLLWVPLIAIEAEAEAEAQPAPLIL